MRLAIGLFAVLLLTSSACGDTIQFEVFGTSVGSSSTYIGTNYSAAGSTVGAIDNSGLKNGLTLLFHDLDNSGTASNGDTISVGGGDTGSFKVQGTGGAWQDGTFQIDGLTLTLGNGSDGQGHHIEDGGTIAWTYDADSTIGGLSTFSGTGVATDMHSGIFNHVVLSETTPGMFDIDIHLWTGLLSPSDASSVFGTSNPFQQGLGTDLSLSGSGFLVPEPGPTDGVPEPAAWMIWMFVGAAIAGMRLFQSRRNAAYRIGTQHV